MPTNGERISIVSIEAAFRQRQRDKMLIEGVVVDSELCALDDETRSLAFENQAFDLKRKQVEFEGKSVDIKGNDDKAGRFY